MNKLNYNKDLCHFINHVSTVNDSLYRIFFSLSLTMGDNVNHFL